ncbi:DUF1311 domain-containing protein [Candidatus Poribacteria bacterium]|nr:DUF1311 domain-containing protein [Candidatus Poribacteria bacterium]
MNHLRIKDQRRFIGGLIVLLALISPVIINLRAQPKKAPVRDSLSEARDAFLDACEEFQKTDAELNKMYKQILDVYKDNTLFINKLKIAQRAWINFRDAHVESLYPGDDKLLLYGSVYPMCRCIVLNTLTRQRIEQLQQWLAGTEEGDVCSGSIRIRGAEEEEQGQMKVPEKRKK